MPATSEIPEPRQSAESRRSPEQERRQPDWDDDRSQRREAAKANGGPNDADAYKLAKIGTALSGALNDQRQRDVKDKRRERRDVDDDFTGREYDGFQGE